MDTFRSKPSSRGKVRARDLARRYGQELRIARMAAGLTQKQVALRAGVSQQTVSLAERGSLSISLETRCTLAAACGHELSLRLFPVASVSLRDSGQLELAEQVLAMTHSSTTVRMEVPVRPGDSRAADLVMRAAIEIVHMEIERSPFDLQAQVRAAAIKRDILAESERLPVRLVIVIPSTAANRARLRQASEVLQRVLPVPSRKIARCLRTGDPIGGDGILLLAPRRTGN